MPNNDVPLRVLCFNHADVDLVVAIAVVLCREAATVRGLKCRLLRFRRTIGIVCSQGFGERSVIAIRLGEQLGVVDVAITVDIDGCPGRQAIGGTDLERIEAAAATNRLGEHLDGCASCVNEALLEIAGDVGRAICIKINVGALRGTIRFTADRNPVSDGSGCIVVDVRFRHIATQVDTGLNGTVEPPISIIVVSACHGAPVSGCMTGLARGKNAVCLEELRRQGRLAISRRPEVDSAFRPTLAVCIDREAAIQAIAAFPEGGGAHDKVLVIAGVCTGDGVTIGLEQRDRAHSGLEFSVGIAIKAAKLGETVVTHPACLNRLEGILGAQIPNVARGTAIGGKRRFVTDRAVNNTVGIPVLGDGLQPAIEACPFRHAAFDGPGGPRQVFIACGRATIIADRGRFSPVSHAIAVVVDAHGAAALVGGDERCFGIEDPAGTRLLRHRGTCGAVHLDRGPLLTDDVINTVSISVELDGDARCVIAGDCGGLPERGCGIARPFDHGHHTRTVIVQNRPALHPALIAAVAVTVEAGGGDEPVGRSHGLDAALKRAGGRLLRHRCGGNPIVGNYPVAHPVGERVAIQVLAELLAASVIADRLGAARPQLVGIAASALFLDRCVDNLRSFSPEGDGAGGPAVGGAVSIRVGKAGRHQPVIPNGDGL